MTLSYRRNYRTSWWGDEDRVPAKVNLDEAPENPYQYTNWLNWQLLGKPRKMVKVLSDGTVFWSRGETADCDHCHTPLRKSPQFARFTAIRHGQVYSGWSCNGNPSFVPMEPWV